MLSSSSCQANPTAAVSSVPTRRTAPTACSYSDEHWNHIEGAIAYARGLPVLILKEASVRSEVYSRRAGSATSTLRRSIRAFWTSLLSMTSSDAGCATFALSPKAAIADVARQSTLKGSVTVGRPSTRRPVYSSRPDELTSCPVGEPPSQVVP